MTKKQSTEKYMLLKMEKIEPVDKTLLKVSGQLICKLEMSVRISM